MHLDHVYQVLEFICYLPNTAFYSFHSQINCTVKEDPGGFPEWREKSYSFSVDTRSPHGIIIVQFLPPTHEANQTGSCKNMLKGGRTVLCLWLLWRWGSLSRCLWIIQFWSNSLMEVNQLFIFSRPLILFWNTDTALQESSLLSFHLFSWLW